MTAAAHPKAVPIEIGGKVRYLLYNLNAFERMSDRGVNPYHLTDAALQDPKWQKTVLWAGLTTDDPTLTPDDVGAWVDLENFADVMLTVTEAFNKSASQKVRGPSPLGEAGAMLGTGSLSTSSGTPPSA